MSSSQVGYSLLLLADGLVAAVDLSLELTDVLFEVADGLREARVLGTHPKINLANYVFPL